MSPFRSTSCNEVEFFTQYRQFEKNMKKYTSMKIALINGPIAHAHTVKPKYLMQTIDDVIKIRDISKEMKLKLKLTINFLKLIKGRNLSRYEIEGVFNQLREIRNVIIGIHITSVFNKDYIHDITYKDGKGYLNKFAHPKNSDLLGCLSSLLNDNQSRYFVPGDIKNANDLEGLVDDLLRGGFSFCSQEVK